MRWSEIVEDVGVVQTAKQTLMSVLSSLKAQHISKITVEQLVDILKKDPDLQGINLENDIVNQALQGAQGFNIEPDPESGKMSVFIDGAQAGRQVDNKQAKKDDDHVHAAAMRTLDKDSSL